MNILNDKELYRLYWQEGLSLADIAKIKKVTLSMIYRCFISANIPRRSVAEAIHTPKCLDKKIGKPLSEETKQKISKANKGSHRSIKTKQQMSNHHADVSGNNNPNYRHGYSGIQLYKTWGMMKNRCYSKGCSGYKYYGKKGIGVCNEWRNNFVGFYNWALNNGYADNLTIDRIEHTGNYTPENCQWIPKSENTRKAQRIRWKKHKEERLERD